MKEKRINSIKRSAIYEALKSSKEHPNAEMLYAELKETYPKISLGTIYRNLVILEHDGEIVKVCSADGKDRYDACTTPHAHFICNKCSRVLDIDCPKQDTAEYFKDIGLKYGYIPQQFKFELHGLCDICSQ